MPPREGGWAELPEELVEKVLEVMQAAEHQAGGVAFTQAFTTARLVCAAWKAIHDALVTRLLLSRRNTDEAMVMLVKRFPAVASIEFKSEYVENALTDVSVRAVSSLHALTSLDLSRCVKVTDEGLRAVRNCTALTSLNLSWCDELTDEALRTVSSLHALTFLHLSHCLKLTDEGLRAVSSLPALTSLNLFGCERDSSWRAGAPQHHRRPRLVITSDPAINTE
jgi:hypothetical protein